MFELLLRTLEVFKKINNICKFEIVHLNEFLEQEENLKDFSNLLKEYEQILTNLEKMNPSDEDTIIEEMIYLHLKLSDSIWHLNQVHCIVKNTAGNYREKIQEIRLR